MESSSSSSAGEGQRRAMMAKLKKLRQENLHLKLRLHAQEQHTSTANKTQVEELKEQFVQMQADKEQAEMKLAVVATEREPLCFKSELDDTMKLPHGPLPELTQGKEKDERPQKMVAAMTSALVKMGTYHQELDRQTEALEDQEVALKDKKKVLAVEISKTKKELEMVQQEVNMQQRNLRKKKIKRSKPVHK